MTKDHHKGIRIAYNFLNLPERINFTNGKWISFTYDAEGVKHGKVVSGEGGWITKSYLSGIAYNGDAIESIFHPEGRLVPDEKQASGFRYEYTLNDHLGNGRVFFSDVNGDGLV